MTQVKFLIDKPADEFTHKDEIETLGVFAFFPNEKYNSESGLCTSYAHIGQHSACHIDYANECEAATKEQYEALKKELESIGYELEILN